MTYITEINLNITHSPPPYSSMWSLSKCFPTKTLYSFPIFYIQATCLAHFIFLDFNTMTTCQSYKSWILLKMYWPIKTWYFITISYNLHTWENKGWRIISYTSE